MTAEELLTLAAVCGFEHAGELNVKALVFDPAVRDMCAQNRCRSYGKSWCCPPACGELEELAQKAGRFRGGVLVQTTAQLEDDFDFESMAEAEKLHKARFARFAEAVRRAEPDCMPLGAGTCTLCAKCTYPDAPCRFPDKTFPSMEAAGLMVSGVCRDSGLPYYYGPHTLTYTSCVLTD